VIGQTFNRLTVIAFDRKQRGYKYYRCRCTCGSETVVREDHLQMRRHKIMRFFAALHMGRIPPMATGRRADVTAAAATFCFPQLDAVAGLEPAASPPVVSRLLRPRPYSRQRGLYPVELHHALATIHARGRSS
jgi:hypothetical protein